MNNDSPRSPWRQHGHLFLVVAGVVGVAVLPGARARAEQHAASPSSGQDTSSDKAAEGLDLSKAIALALAHNPEIEAARYGVKADSAELNRAKADDWPRLDVVVGMTEYRRPQRLFPPTGPGDPVVSSHHHLKADLVASLPLFSGWRTRHNVQAAEASIESARFAAHRVEDEVVYRVASTYFTILAQRRFCTALRTDKNALKAHIKTISALVSEGKAAPLDLQRVEVRLAALEQTEIQEGNALEVQSRTLLFLTGMGKTRKDVAIHGELAVVSHVESSAVEALVARALKQRPDVLAARADLRSQGYHLSSTRAGYWPRVFAQGAYGLHAAPWPAVQPDGVDAWADVGQLSLVVDAPVFDGWRVASEVDKQQAKLDVSMARLHHLELRVRLEVESAALRVKAASARVALAEKATSEAREAFRIETEKQAVGKSTVSDALSAQADLIDAEANQSQALADANIAAVALKLATGERP